MGRHCAARVSFDERLHYVATPQVVFYAVDGAPDQSRSQSVRSYGPEIRRLREGVHRDIPRAVLVAQLPNRRELTCLDGVIDYAALGDRHYVDGMPGVGYAGAPVGRDANKPGDNGPRHYLSVTGTDGPVVPVATRLSSGGYQCKVRRHDDGHLIEFGPASPDDPRSERVRSDAPGMVLDVCDRISQSEWTTIALTKDVLIASDVLEECRHRFGTSRIMGHRTKAGMTYVTRSDGSG
jgi:hypothetical protein